MSETQLSSVDSGYAKRRKEHLALINQLRAIGAQADLDLPRIAVIGNQSAGKSSLVEAISGINVPRDAGTCTRCPMECRLAFSSGPWQCQVSIRWEYNADGTLADEIREDFFGDVITDKSKVELALRRAQLAILNPKQTTRKFVDMDVDTLKSSSFDGTLKFSRNVVCVDLMGPELTDLAFVDLPGIIQNAEKETVELVEELVRSHIKGNCLILVTVPMSDDIENQKALQIANQEDPKGSRTIGVMTKPDTLTVGATKARGIWLDVIEGRRSQLRHGYYCTRQPDDDERTNGITAEQARKAEADFFARTSPWSSTAHPERFGTRNLIASLSKLLSGIIDDTLPKLQSQVTSQLQNCTARLAALPPQITTEPASYVLSLVTTFCGDINLLVHGDSEHAALVQQNRKTYAAYKKEIRSSAPQFVPYPTRREEDSAWQDPDLDGEDEDEQLDPHDDGKLYLEDVRRHIQISLTRELPNNVPYSAKIALIHKTQDSWQLDSHKCLSTVQKSLEKTVTQLVNTHFQRYDTLKGRLIHYVMELLRDKYGETWKQILFALGCEGRPYTQNGHYLQVTKDKWLAKYKDARAGKTPFNDGPSPKKRRTAPKQTPS
ncbi:hypothetical protein EIP91_005824 [Steccherinum ochraceum]|uniref:Dynamin-type G domain-containing protein n=1 Tax=Steccherinum ochraceum TaxID=92696 RepID=A0A4R0R6X7_9APHY|nr:hypothetical protein EIP91_005824 [Steccherinum ochraceum]